MNTHSVTALANPNIAFIKYWGNRDPELRLPANSSLSMNLDGLFTTTRVVFDSSLPSDRLKLNGAQVSGPPLERVQRFLEQVRRMAGADCKCAVDSLNNFPTGSGIASSASAFAALSLAATAALGLDLSEQELSRLARLGSGSACRSIPAGFVEWQAGEGNPDSYAFSIASPDHWDLVDIVVITSRIHKPVGSSQGHILADTSPLQKARVEDAPRRLEVCRSAVLERDFDTLARVVEQDCLMMHAVMMTSHPRLVYWKPATLAVMEAVQGWRRDGIPVCFTIDAGPNVHLLAPGDQAEFVAEMASKLPGVEGILTARPGGAAQVISE